MAGGRPRRDGSERLSAVLAVRVTAAERAHVEARAASSGEPLPAYLRAAITNRPAPPRRRGSAAKGGGSAELVRELNRIGVNLNQLTRAHNYGSDEPLADELAATLAELRAVLGQLV